MFLLPRDSLTSLGICYIPKLSIYAAVLFFPYNAIQWVPVSKYSSRLVIYASSFILLGRLSLL